MEQQQTTFHHILLADDDRDHGFLFHCILQKQDASKKISQVHDGEALLQFLATHTPDLIFLDLNMPCKHGFECLDIIKGSDRLKHIPVIVYSSSSQLSDIKASYIHKADFYMVKPFSSKHLEQALASIFSLDWNAGSPLNSHYYINNRFVPFTAAAQ
jgi:CheY-like chemotaxis protein